MLTFLALSYTGMRGKVKYLFTKRLACFFTLLPHRFSVCFQKARLNYLQVNCFVRWTVTKPPMSLLSLKVRIKVLWDLTVAHRVGHAATDGTSENWTHLLAFPTSWRASENCWLIVDGSPREISNFWVKIREQALRTPQRLWSDFRQIRPLVAATPALMISEILILLICGLDLVSSQTVSDIQANKALIRRNLDFGNMQR